MGNPLFPGKGSRTSAAPEPGPSSSLSSSFIPGLLGGSFSASSSKYSKTNNEYDPSYHPGTLNLGNTCFLNSVIQAIGNTRDFRLLVEGPPVPASYFEEPPTSTTAALVPSRHNQWPNRVQSPALRVSDNEHGRRIDHPPNPNGSLNSSLASLNTLPAHDPVTTIKPGKLPLPVPGPLSSHQNGAAPSTSMYEPDALDLPLNTAFRHVLEQFWTDAHKPRNSININPKRLLNQLGKKYDQYLEYGQQDGHELMRHLLDACRMEELDVIKKMRPPPPNKKANLNHASSTTTTTTTAAAAASTTSPLNRLTPADMENGQIVSHPAASSIEADGVSAAPTEEELLPFLDLLFCGKLASMVVCEGCKKVSHTYEDFYDISLSLRDDANNPKSRKRDRLRSMADRWRKATQARTIMDRKSAAAATAAGSNSITPVGTPRYSETEASDADSNALQRNKSAAGFLSPDEGRRRFQLRTRSLRKSGGRHEKLGATSGSEMEPDFPDMASLSLAPSPGSRPYIDSAPASAGEDNGDARTNTRVARMLGSVTTAADASSRETSPNPPLGHRTAATDFGAGMRPPLPAIKSSSHQTAYIARIMADNPASAASSGAPRKAGAPSPLVNVVAAAAAAQGKPINGFFRSPGAGARARDPCADFEPDPKSQGAKRRQKIREEQAATGLISSLRQFTSAEVLEGENSFACKNCWRLANPPNAQEREKIRRRRRRRGIAAAEEDDEEGSEPSSSDGESDREGQYKEKRGGNVESAAAAAAAADVTLTNPNGVTSSASKSTLASSADSVMTGSSASHPSHVQSDIPTISMTSADASTDDIQLKMQRSHSGSINGGAAGGDVVARDYAAGPGSMSSSNGSYSVVMHRDTGSQSSFSSVEGAGARTGHARANTDKCGYETGTETDMSGFSTGMSESNASTGEGTDTEAEGEDGNKKPSSASDRTGPKRSAQSLPRRALKRYLIASAPPVLIFHLKRFQATGRGFVSGLAGFKKIDDQVTFPEYLDITPWLAPPREEYDRRGRLKASSDPLAIRRRAEEEATSAGVDARHVKVQVSPAHRKHGGRKGRKHGMWSWHLSDHAKHQDRGAAGENAVGAAGDLEEGPKVHTSGGKEIVPSVIRRPKTEYRLYAVIVHQGSLSAGHYTAYVLSDRIKLKEGQKETVARSAPTSRTNTPAPSTGGVVGGLGQLFLGGGSGSKDRPSRTNMSSPAPVPIRPASAAPLASNSVAMTSIPSNSSVSGASSHDTAPQTSISSLDTDSSQHSIGSGSDASISNPSSTGPKLIRPRPQLKPMASWDSLDELEQSHTALPPNPNGAATPTNYPGSGSVTPLEPTRAVPTVASHNSNAHRHVEPKLGGEGEDDDVDPRKKDDGRRWVYTSDTIVRAASIDEVLKCKAYMLFYERL
ncbi:uncharacterized protein UHOD_01293 [Ustilago sp. UG-2017b]|nr:uncharacterized protein UHOD_01293 [Ustilago sp. UG-2017b]